ncbi:MAG: DUF302 domain-containing protein [Deltaproteobacteria bacterium]|nr:DUF302 domain-containing protein [Deltaproteobacteria bacterium]
MSDLVIARGAHDHTETLSRAVTAIEARGFAIVQRIDHAAAAATAGQELPPSTVLVFGNPKAGTQLMLLAPSLALDLPLRLVVWKAGEIVQVAYRRPASMVATHGLAEHAIVTKMTDALAAIASDATR